MMSCKHWMRIFFLVATSVGTIGPALAQQSSPAAQPLAAQANESETGTEEKPIAIPEVKVKEMREEGYRAKEATTGSKIELPLRDVPQSVTVITQEALRDIAPARIHQVADYVAGVGVFASAATPYTNAFFLRGFGSTSGSTFNGFRDGGFLTTQSLINLERIEFLKGPTSVLYGGSAALSGLVNYVSKQPLAEPMGEITVGAGSFGHFLTTLDATGPMSANKRARYRLTAAYDYGGNHRKDYDQQSRFISPYFSVDLTERTQLDLEVIAQDTRFDGRENFLPRHPVSFRLPVETNLGPGGNGADQRRVVRLDLKHRFAGDWTLRQGLYYSDMEKTKDFSFQFLAVNANGVTGTRRVRSVPEAEADRASQTELSGSFATGPLKHKLLLGMELAKRRFAFDFFVATATNVNLFDPQPGVQTGPLVLSGVPTQSGADTTAFYVQDLIELPRGWKLMLGGRLDEVEQFSRPKGGAPAPGRLIRNSAFSPRLGLIYQPTPATSLYGSWTKSFAPTLGLSATGASFDPQEGEQYEIGVKHDLRPDLSVSAALFDFTRQNVLTADPANPVFSIAVGKQRSRGLELEASGRVTRDYSIVSSYAYLDARVTRDNRLPVGDRLAGVPRHSFALFNKLRLTALGAAQWSATLGLVYAGERESALPNSTAAFTSAQLRLPSYTRVDAGLIYETGPYTLRLMGTNLTNEKIYDSNAFSIAPRAPRAFHALLGYRF